MAKKADELELDTANWHFALTKADLDDCAVKMLRIEGRQIAFFNTESGVKACDNRCPHEGYPLSEGSLSKNCTLTCNWHNWKFNLESGENLLGGDKLRIYPVENRGEEIWVEIKDPPYAQQYNRIVDSLQDAFDDYSYDRIGREIARLEKLGADPFDALRKGIEWSWQKLEFGWTHAYAGMADWLDLHQENRDDPERQLVCLMESLAHISYDVLREKDYLFSETVSPYVEDEFVSAIETEDEDSAVAAIRGGLQKGLGFADFESGFSRAALAHYNDFGHSVIYVTKARKLIQYLGPSIQLPVLLALVRSIIYASREDRIPEFRAYADYLSHWGESSNIVLSPDLWRGKGINKSMQSVVECSTLPAEKIYHSLLLANAVNLLNFDIEVQDKVHVSVSGNVGWLDFTHGLTFAEAIHQQCRKFPNLWPQALLQLACFCGRNAAFTLKSGDIEIGDFNHNSAIGELVNRVFDHGQGEHIVAVHLLKTALSVRTEIQNMESAEAALLVASVKRFFDSPLKRRQPRRTAHQSLQFVAKE